MIERFGGPGRDRTDDLFHAMEARSNQDIGSDVTDVRVDQFVPALVL